MTYQQQIKDPRWQKKRLQVFSLHKFKCQVCGAKTEELHAHHPFYKRGAMIWEYDKTELECLCHRCHKNAHEVDEKIRKALALCKNKQKVLDYILSLNSPQAQMSQHDIEPYPSFYKRYLEDKRKAEDEEARAEAEEMKRQLYDDPTKTPEQTFFDKMRAMLG